MGDIIDRPPVNHTIGFIYKADKELNKAKADLTKLYGDFDFESEVIEFAHTNYYDREMGGPLYRQFASFKKLISPEELPDIKIKTNDIEDTLRDGQDIRQVNLDPGYLSASKLVLATTKNQQQRLYLSKGIYGENELYFQAGKFNHWPWTYPDYQTEAYKAIFMKIRKIYAAKIKEQGFRFI